MYLGWSNECLVLLKKLMKTSNKLIEFHRSDGLFSFVLRLFAIILLAFL